MRHITKFTENSYTPVEFQSLTPGTFFVLASFNKNLYKKSITRFVNGQARCDAVDSCLDVCAIQPDEMCIVIPSEKISITVERPNVGN